MKIPDKCCGKCKNWIVKYLATSEVNTFWNRCSIKKGKTPVNFLCEKYKEKKNENRN
jgi:hypothetical protein